MKYVHLLLFVIWAVFQSGPFQFMAQSAVSMFKYDGDSNNECH